MVTVWAVGEVADGKPSKLTLELATTARSLGGGETATLLVGERAAAAAAEVAAFSTRVMVVETGAPGGPVAASMATRIAALVSQRSPDLLLIGATPDGKDVAGALVGLTDLPILVNGSGMTWEDGAPHVEMSTFGGRLVTRSTFTGSRGIILIRPSSVTAEQAQQTGEVEAIPLDAVDELPPVRVTDRVAKAGAAASIDDARVIVGGGRGVGDAQGFRLIQDLADALGGAVGATRAVVDAGWIAYGQQIGQTGKIVKPSLYLACGISGAIQHKVGVQTAGTIVAINKDPDAPIAEFADLLVVGDLFQIVPALTEAIQARRRGSS